MEASGFTLFETAIGWCGIAWSDDGLTMLQLPEATAAATRARLVRHLPATAREWPPPTAASPGEAPGPLPPAASSQPASPAGPLPPFAARAVDGVAALLAGADDDLVDVRLDMDGLAPFHREVYAVARAIPPGATITYGEVCDCIGAGRAAARAVGQALGANPFPIVVPCHRVTAAGGRTGGFSAGDGVSTKLRLLEIERVHASAHGAPTLF